MTGLLESQAYGSLSIANSYEYGPFGQIRGKTENVESPYQFNTKYTDGETGLVYYGYRYYDTDNGRWLNRDPLSTDGGLNVYNSVSNSMVNGFSGGIKNIDGMELAFSEITKSLGVDPYGLWKFKYANISTTPEGGKIQKFCNENPFTMFIGAKEVLL